jgi:hypothetical protein
MIINKGARVVREVRAFRTTTRSLGKVGGKLCFDIINIKSHFSTLLLPESMWKTL